jgi:hypothetical protein
MPAAPVGITLSSAWATRTLTLATTVQTIEIPRAIAGQISGLRIVADTAGGFQVRDDLGAADSVAPTTDYVPLPADTGWPVEIGIHARSAAADEAPIYVNVWAASGTPVLFIQPIPVGR